METKAEKNIQKIEYYIFIFIIASVCGWFIEMVYSSIALRRLNPPGFLFGPYVPIYGIGATLIVAFCDDKNIFKRIGKIFISTTLLEYIASVLLEMIVHKKWWDYSNNFLNINGRVSLLYSFYWVILGLAILEFLKPVFESLYNRIKGEKTTKILIGIIVIMIIDLIFSVLYYILN